MTVRCVVVCHIVLLASYKLYGNSLNRPDGWQTRSSVLMCVFLFTGMINKLQLDDKGDMGFIGDVAKSIFSDRTTNWGRITSLVAFGAVVAKHQKENGKKDCVELVAREISSYLLKEQRDWLIKNNAWVSCD